MARNVRAYALAQAYADIFPSPIPAQRAPTINDKGFPIGQLWIDIPNDTSYILTSVAANQAQWQEITNAGGGAGVFATLTVTGLTTLNGSVNMAPTAAASTITLGNAAMTGNIIVGASTAGQAVSISGAANAGAQSVSIASGTNAANSSVNINNGAFTAGVNTTNIGSGAAVTAGSKVINIAQGAVAVDETVNILSDTPTAGTQVLNLGAQNTNPIAINIGNGTGVATVGIANSNAAHQVTIGSTDTTATTTIQAGTGGIILDAAGIVSMAPVADTQASPSATAVINARVGKATFTGFTTASAAVETFTITNALVTAASGILLSAHNEGANDAKMTVSRIIAGAGTFDVILTNNGAAALNGDVVITFWVID